MRIPKRAAAATAFVTAVAAAAAVYLFAPAVREPAAGPDAAPVPATADAPHRPSAGRVYPFRRVVALVIGIDGYPHLAGPADLTCAERDARAVGDLLAEKFGYEVVRLLGPAATKAALDLPHGLWTG